ncbi:Armadillo-type fold [Trinorchestia longiramus]|nr:Armadillo-type fold [Trinorchestia longiramus]
MGNILKVISPVPGVKDDTSGSDFLPCADVNTRPAEQITEACITSLHASLVKLLEGKLCPNSPVSSKLKGVLACAEQEMLRLAIPVTTPRHRCLWDVLNEDWLEPHCSFPDTIDFWPPPPPRFLPWRTALASSSCVTSLCMSSSQSASEEETKEAEGLYVEKSLLTEEVQYEEATNSSQEGFSSPPRQTSYSNCDFSVKTDLKSSYSPVNYFSSRPVTFAKKISAEGDKKQFDPCVHNVTNTNSTMFCDRKSHCSENWSTIINEKCRQEFCNAAYSCATSLPSSTSYDEFVSPFDSLYISSSNYEKLRHYGLFQTSPISFTQMKHTNEKALPSEFPFIGNTSDPPPPSSSRLTCPSIPLSKLQLLQMLLEPVAHLAASHRRHTHQELCSAEVCTALLAAVSCPDHRVQEAAAKAVANMACSTAGATILHQTGAPAALQPLVSSPCFAVQLAACRALLNLRRQSIVSDLHSGIHPSVDLHSLVLHRLTPTREPPGACLCSGVGQTSNMHGETGASCNNIMNSVHLNNFDNDLSDDFMSAVCTPAPSHKHGAACHGLSSNYLLPSRGDSVHSLKTYFRNQLICNEQHVCHNCSEVPLLQCDRSLKNFQHPSRSSFDDFESSGLLNICSYQSERSKSSGGEVPVYEEGIYPVLSASDLHQLSKSILFSSNGGDFSGKNENELVSQLSDFVSIQIPPGFSLEENHAASRESPLLGKYLDYVSATPRIETNTQAWNIGSCSDGTSASNEQRSAPAHEGASMSGQPPRVVDVVLLHGILGGAAWTWRQHDDARCNSFGGGEPGGYSWCWPRDWLAQDLLTEEGTQLRIIAVNVSEPWRLCDVRSVVEEGKRLRGVLVRAGVGQRPLVWLTHSHGGLLLKAILHDSQHEAAAADDCSPPASGVTSAVPGALAAGALCSSTVGVVFLSTPHQGAAWAGPAALLHSDIPELIDLRPGELREVQLVDLRPGNAMLAELSRRFERCWAEHKFLVLSVVDAEPLRLCPGLSVRPVPPQSADAGVGETVQVAADHLNICKPLSRKCDVYTTVLRFFIRATSNSP